MFEINDWSDIDDTAETNISNFGNSTTCKKSKKKRKKQENGLKTKSKLLVPSLNGKTKIAAANLVTSRFKDRFLNSPTLTNSLVDNDDSQQNNEELKTTKEMGRNLSFRTNGGENIKVENILNKGLKFTSESQFLKFINHQSKKRKRSKKNETADKKPKLDQPKSVQENETINRSKSAEENKKVESNHISSDRFNPKKNNENELIPHTGFNVDKLSKLLKTASGKSSVKDQEKTSRSLQNEDSDAKRKLKSSRFRFLNEKLYTQSGQESYKMFKNDTEGLNTFKTYHEGYAEQVRKWPIDPLDLIIRYIVHIKN